MRSSSVGVAARRAGNKLKTKRNLLAGIVILAAVVALAVMHLLEAEQQRRWIWPLSSSQAVLPAADERIHATTTHQQPMEENLVSSSTSSLFTVVMLTYKAPKSLGATIRSLVDSNLLQHPSLFEVVVYFQLFDPPHDEALLDGLLKDTGVRYRAIGRAENIAVAKATFIAIRSVVTELVLYLECDRPVYAFPQLTQQERSDHVRNILTNSIEALRVGKNDGQLVATADVVRLQLYANSLVPDDVKALPANKYGTQTFENCFKASTFAAGAGGVCANSKAVKKQFGHVFYTAYCKHWKKVTDLRDTPQHDMCDSFCFFVWASIAHAAALEESRGRGFGAVRQLLSKITGRSKFLNGSSLTAASSRLQESNSSLVASALFAVAKDQQQLLCLTSEDCNWTNQPTMYRKAWYLDNIAAPCEQSTGYCIGKEGRQSAVRQELFFAKNRGAWAARRHKVCIAGAGLFIHDEVDNSE